MMTSIANNATFDEIGVSKPIMIGIIILILFFGGFMGWAAFAPLGSAAIASGVVSVEGSKKTIQHLEGGIVDKILVKNGDFVERGQVLLTLQETQAMASLKLIRGRKMVALAELARLTAERDDVDTVSFSEWLLEQQSDPQVMKTMEGQLSIFKARLLARKGQRTILKQKVAQLDEEIKGLQGQIRSSNIQLKLIKEEITDVGELVRKKLAKRTRLRSLQRNAAELSGNKSQNVARIAQSKQAIGEIQLQMSELRNTVLNEAVAELKNVQAQLFDLEEQERASVDVLNRTEIKAPNSGIIVNLQIHTSGGVIRSGDTLMDIVPMDQDLIVEAEVDTSDIDVVQVGAKAQIRFPAFSQRTSQPVDGTVISVSADSILNERSGAYYYQALVRIDSLEGSNLKLEQLRPGMQADVMIATGERTALDYFLNPILQSFNRAMTEQ
ncbi:MAG: HlyD family type I secretion periplasmic adaptor subunit [Sneathiella sp.]|nr:HlyD family type I secretion periplasmic adaptor subunit [Sneathiella sp.]